MPNRVTPKENYDPYVGSVYGNILDEFDSTTYNVKLYMINKALAQAQAASEPATAASSRADIGDPNPDAILVTNPSQTVVLAQTGVTAGNQIDDLRITTIGAMSVASQVTFTITQPGRADLIDQIQLAKSFLGLDMTVMPNLFLEINFLGRASDINENNLRGEASQIIGPYRFELVITNLTSSLNASGGVFQFECVNIQNLAETQQYKRINNAVSINGENITQMLQSFFTKLNESHSETGDVFELDLSGLLDDSSNFPGPPRITDQRIKLSTLPGIEYFTTPTTDDPEAQTDADVKSQETGLSAVIRSTVADVVPNESLINLNAGVSIEDVVITVLSMNDQFKQSATRKPGSLSDDTDVTTENRSQAAITWVRINTTTFELTNTPDAKRGIYARKIVVKPTLYRSYRTDVFLKREENYQLNLDQIKARLMKMRENGALLKSYYWLFTGLNDQILNLDATLNFSHAVLLAPRRGQTGSLRAADNGELNATVVETGQVTKPTLSSVSTASPTELRDIIGQAVNSLASQDRLNEFEQVLQQANIDGLPPDASAGDQQALQRFLATLSEDQTRLLAAGIVRQAGETQSPGQTDSEDRYRFSEDFLSENQATEIDVSDLVVTEVNNIGISERVTSLFYEKNKAETAADVPSVGENTLFGVLINQHQEKTFLTKLDMEIRGDPWYLGPDVGSTSQGTQGVQAGTGTGTYQNLINRNSTDLYMYPWGDDNLFLLTIKAPPPQDRNLEDEDANTGYWDSGPTQYTFSGVYRLTLVQHIFDRGRYTNQITAVRLAEMEIAGLPPEPFEEAND